MTGGRTLEFLHSQGAVFDASLEVPKYDYMVIHADKMEPVDYATHRDEIVKFYSNVQPQATKLGLIEEMFKVLVEDVFWDRTFYLYCACRRLWMLPHAPQTTRCTGACTSSTRSSH